MLVVLTWPIMTSDDEDEWIMNTKMLTGAGAADDGREWADAAGGRGSGNGGGIEVDVENGPGNIEVAVDV